VDFFRQCENDQEITPSASSAHPVRFRFSLRETQSAPGNTQEEIVFTWNAGTPRLPNFHGTLRVRPAPETGTTLLLEGNYTPSPGLFGSLFDRFFARAAARQAVETLLRQIAERLENEQRLFTTCSLRASLDEDAILGRL
jgi:hypothetical protein